MTKNRQKYMQVSKYAQCNNTETSMSQIHVSMNNSCFTTKRITSPLTVIKMKLHASGAGTTYPSGHIE